MGCGSSAKSKYATDPSVQVEKSTCSTGNSSSGSTAPAEKPAAKPDVVAAAKPQHKESNKDVVPPSSKPPEAQKEAELAQTGPFKPPIISSEVLDTALGDLGSLVDGIADGVLGANFVKQVLLRMSEHQSKDKMLRFIEKDEYPGHRAPKSLVHITAAKGRADVLRILLELGAAADAKDPEGNTALHFAVELGHCRTVQVLLKARADPSMKNLFGSSASSFADAAPWDSDSIVKHKERIRDMLSGTALEYELLPLEPVVRQATYKSEGDCVLGDIDAVKRHMALMFSKAATTNHLEIALDAVINTTEEASGWLNAHTSEFDSPKAASRTVSAVTMSSSTNGGKDAATKFPEMELAAALADTTQLCDDVITGIFSEQFLREALLLMAKQDGCGEMLRFAQDTLMPSCSGHGRADIVQMLLSLGAGVDSRDAQGATALHLAIQSGHANVAHVLLKSGANASFCNESGFNAAALVDINGSTSVEVAEGKKLIKEMLNGSFAGYERSSEDSQPAS